MKGFHWIYAAVVIIGSAATQLAAEAGDRWRELHQAGLALHEQGHFEKARIVLLDALAEAEKQLPDNGELPATLHTLGVTEKSLQRYADARRHLEAALEIWSTGNDRGPQMAITLETLGNLLAETGDWDAAERRLLAALAVNERTYGGSSGQVAMFLSRTAEVYFGRGLNERTRLMLGRALAIQKESLSAGDLAVLTNQLKLAYTLRLLGDFDAARRHALDAETAGRSSPIYPEILSFLGDTYRMEGNVRRAVPLLRRAISLAAAPGSDRELPAAVLSLAYIDQAEGRRASARNGFQRGIAIMKQKWGSASPEIAPAQVGLALVLVEERKYDEASALLDAAHPVLENELYADDPTGAVELMLRATMVVARGDRSLIMEAARLATVAIEHQAPRNQVALWATYARLMKPYRPDFARTAEKRGRTLVHGFHD